MDESFDSAYLTVTSGRSTGYSTRSRPNSSRSPYNRDSAAPLVAMSTPRRLRGEMSPSYSSRSLYSPGYDSALEDPVEDDYVSAKKTTIPRPQTKAPILVKKKISEICVNLILFSLKDNCCSNDLFWQRSFFFSKMNVVCHPSFYLLQKRSTVVTTNTTPRELYSAPAYEDNTDSFEDG